MLVSRINLSNHHKHWRSKLFSLLEAILKQRLKILHFILAVFYQSPSQYCVGWPMPTLFCWKWENWVYQLKRSYFNGDKRLLCEFTHLAPCASLKSCQVVENLLLVLYHISTRATQVVKDSHWSQCHHPVLLVTLWLTWKQDDSRGLVCLYHFVPSDVFSHFSMARVNLWLRNKRKKQT